MWPPLCGHGGIATAIAVTPPSQIHGDLFGKPLQGRINGRRPGFSDPVSLFTPSNEITFSTCHVYVFSCFCNPPINKVKQPECSSLQGAVLATRRREDRCPGCNMSFSCTTWRVSYIHPSRVLADASSRLWSQNERLWSCSAGSLLRCLQM